MAEPNNPASGLKRFYDTVEVQAEAAGYSIRLDGRAVRTPAKAVLLAPTEALAALIAEEWRAQGDAVRLETMPATRLAHTAFDRIGPARAAVAAGIAHAAASDLLCYFAEAPQSLVERQTQRWGAMLDWAESELGLSFTRGAGVIPHPQPPQTLACVEAMALALDDFTLAGVSLAASLFGSAILAFAVQRDLLDGNAAFDLSRLDEAFQEEQWGVDAEAAARTEAMRAEAVMLERWFLALA